MNAYIDAYMHSCVHVHTYLLAYTCACIQTCKSICSATQAIHVCTHRWCRMQMQHWCQPVFSRERQNDPLSVGSSDPSNDWLWAQLLRAHNAVRSGHLLETRRVPSSVLFLIPSIFVSTFNVSQRNSQTVTVRDAYGSESHKEKRIFFY